MLFWLLEVLFCLPLSKFFLITSSLMSQVTCKEERSLVLTLTGMTWVAFPLVSFFFIPVKHKESRPRGLIRQCRSCHFVNTSDNGEWWDSPSMGFPHKIQDTWLILNLKNGHLCFHLLNLATLRKVGYGGRHFSHPY